MTKWKDAVIHSQSVTRYIIKDQTEIFVINLTRIQVWDTNTILHILLSFDTFMIRNQNKVNNQKNSIVKTNSLCLKVCCKTETKAGQENDYNNVCIDV